jgi:defect in organelle trafficking protein DotD
MKFPFIAFSATIVLSGCQPKHTVPPCSLTKITIDADRILSTQQQLYLGGSINQKPLRFPASFSANSDRMTLAWEGDAIELLNQLARQRDLNFTYSGVRLPLPVSINAKNITFENLLHQLETQIGWRATFEQRSHEIHLFFTLPDKGGRLS